MWEKRATVRVNADKGAVGVKKKITSDVVLAVAEKL